jgi:hypothetical protein
MSCVASTMETHMANHLIPHSSEWFEKLLAENPQQALHTGAVIEVTGRDDICSICGNDPAFDYVLVDPEPGEVASMRFCKDCVGFRATQGEFFKLLVDQP